MVDVDRNQKQTMIATDGGLRTIPSYLVNDLQKQGWRIVINPKRTYFPEFDSTHPNYRKPEEEEELDVLQVERI